MRGDLDQYAVRIVSAHEAGHVLAALVLGYYAEAWIHPNGGQCVIPELHRKWPGDERTARELMLVVAGAEAAEKLLLPRLQRNKTDNLGDRIKMFRLADEFGGDDAAGWSVAAQERALAMLARNIDPLDRVNAKLIAHGFFRSRKF